MGAIDVNFFRFIPTARLSFGSLSHKFSILENFTRKALRKGGTPTYNFSGNTHTAGEIS